MATRVVGTDGTTRGIRVPWVVIVFPFELVGVFIVH